MKICPNCNSASEDYSSVCNSCGLSLASLEGNKQFNPSNTNTNGMSIASLVLGITSIPLVCCYVGAITGIIAIVLGFIARKNIKSTGGTQPGNGMALAGIILGFVAIAIVLVLVALVVVLRGVQPEYLQQLIDQNQIQKQ